MCLILTSCAGKQEVVLFFFMCWSTVICCSSTHLFIFWHHEKCQTAAVNFDFVSRIQTVWTFPHEASTHRTSAFMSWDIWTVECTVTDYFFLFTVWCWLFCPGVEHCCKESRPVEGALCFMSGKAQWLQVTAVHTDMMRLSEMKLMITNFL